jgi:hypothetical protein
MADQILKKEDKLDYLGGFLNRKRGSLVLTPASLSFISKDSRLFDIPLSDITSVNPKKGVGNGVDHLEVLYTEDGKDKKVKLQHFSFISSGMGTLSRITLYFTSWEQMINDARFKKLS